MKTGRFSDMNLKKGVKDIINSIIIDAENLNNVKNVAFISTITTKEKYSDKVVRMLNTNTNNVYTYSHEVIIKSFFRAYADCIITKSNYLSKMNKNIDYMEVAKSEFFRSEFKKHSIYKNNKKNLFIADMDPSLAFYAYNYVIQDPLMEVDIFTSEKKADNLISKHKEFYLNKFNKEAKIEVNKITNNPIILDKVSVNTLENLSLRNIISESYKVSLFIIINILKRGSEFNFIEGFQPKTLDYLDEENAQLNPIDFIINLNYYREGFMFDAPNKSIISSELKKLKKKSVEDQREASKNDMLKYFKIPPSERMEFIKMKGEIIDYNKILDKYQPINMKSMPIGTEITNTENPDDSHKEYSKIVTLELYKKKGITNNILNDQQKEFIDYMKKKRVKKNKEIMRGLIRDN